MFVTLCRRNLPPGIRTDMTNVSFLLVISRRVIEKMIFGEMRPRIRYLVFTLRWGKPRKTQPVVNGLSFCHYHHNHLHCCKNYYQTADFRSLRSDKTSQRSLILDPTVRFERDDLQANNVQRNYLNNSTLCNEPIMVVIKTQASFIRLFMLDHISNLKLFKSRPIHIMVMGELGSIGHRVISDIFINFIGILCKLGFDTLKVDLNIRIKTTESYSPSYQITHTVQTALHPAPRFLIAYGTRLRRKKAAAAVTRRISTPQPNSYAA
ncbi:hypothetical protein ANN_01650 [Periplaneta americana]|uniref:Uncharacterized protein n=1 Tax=Periplaneta americana TaxID=6978 RepID=A0ABQ8TVS6_PERAM|nr:hypothetical protein ANN_01650 [Periplaneta americana]